MCRLDGLVVQSLGDPRSNAAFGDERPAKPREHQRQGSNSNARPTDMADTRLSASIRRRRCVMSSASAACLSRRSCRRRCARRSNSPGWKDCEAPLNVVRAMSAARVATIDQNGAGSVNVESCWRWPTRFPTTCSRRVTISRAESVSRPNTPGTTGPTAVVADLTGTSIGRATDANDRPASSRRTTSTRRSARPCSHDRIAGLARATTAVGRITEARRPLRSSFARSARERRTRSASASAARANA